MMLMGNIILIYKYGKNIWKRDYRGGAYKEEMFSEKTGPFTTFICTLFLNEMFSGA
jgi:hypothetical protein